MTSITPSRITTSVRATSASTDQQPLESWVRSLGSPHSRANFSTTGRQFLAKLPTGLRAATVEEVRDALDAITADLAPSSATQYVLRVKSLLSYASKLGFTTFNAGTVIKVKSHAGSRGAKLTKRIITEVEVGLLIGAARSKRDRALLQTLYAAGLRVSEVVGLNWGDVLPRETRLQLSVLGKGDVTRNMLLPALLTGPILTLRGDATDDAPVFVSRLGRRLTRKSVGELVKRTAKRAGLTPKLSPHWLRHAHGSHAIDRGASLPEVQATLGHGNVSTTSGYLHARPDSSSGLKLE